MTIKDAIFVLNCVEAHNGICNEAKEMAIKSLEAWEKVKEEIGQESAYTKNTWEEYPDEWYAGKCNAYGECLRIIDQHLAEVTK